MADRLFILYAVAYIGALIVVTITTNGIVVSDTGIVGGDFLAFYAAGEFALSGNALAAYDAAALDAQLRTHAEIRNFGMLWQYPPSGFFLTAPLALLPYKVSYVLWCAAGWAALVLALRHCGFRGRTLRLLALSPLCLTVVDNGQISLLTAALLIAACFDPKKHWLVAGIMAGLLTIKPQLGILLPIAYLMIGAWRTIAIAAVTALFVHIPSLLVYGVEGWQQFFMAVARLNSDFSGPGSYAPPNGMTTLFGQLRILGVATPLATSLQYLVTAIIAVIIALGWRREASPLAKASLVCAGAILASPYAYAYEMAVLIIPAFFIASRQASHTTPTSYYLIACWAALCVLPALPQPAWINVPFIITASAFVICVRMVWLPQRAATHTQSGQPALQTG